MLSTILDTRNSTSNNRNIFPLYKKLVLLLLLFKCGVGFCETEPFDAVIYHTMVNVAGKDVNKALHTADSLYKEAKEPLQKVKSLMLLAELNMLIGKKEKAVKYVFQAEDITSDKGLYEWQARIYGFLSSHYRSIGLKKQSKIYLEKGLEVIDKAEDKAIINQYKGSCFQELGLYEIENKNYQKAVDYFKKAEPCFSGTRNKDLQTYQYALNNMQLGRAYLFLKDRKNALLHLKKGEKFLSGLKEESSILKGFIYEGIGRAYFEDNDFKNAIKYLNDALEIAKHSDNLNLKEEVYYDLAVYHVEAGDKDKYKEYHKLYLETMESSIKANKDSSEIVVNRLQEREDELAMEQNLILLGSGVIVIALVVMVVLNRSKRKKQHEKFKKILKKINEQSRTLEVVRNSDETPEEIKPVFEVAEKELMSAEVEKAILKKLLFFEQSDKFTNKSITLSALSVMLETNSKYLSYVINKHKKKDFNGYINELRIFYIIKKLEQTPTYLNYKISYLAEECGFSSHSKFTAVFKTVTGMSPSSFMQFLTKDQSKLTA